MRARPVASLLAAAGLVAIAAAPVAAARPSTGYSAPVVRLGPADGRRPRRWLGDRARPVHLLRRRRRHPRVHRRQAGSRRSTPRTTRAASSPRPSTARTGTPTRAGNALTCDGRQQNQQFTVKPDPFFWNAADAPLLSDGEAFIQVCIFDSTNTGEMDPNGFAFDYSMRKVVAN